MSGVLCFQCISYSGITTKVRAMQGRLITDTQFQEMAAQDSVVSAVNYLKRLPAYTDTLDGMEEHDMHRSRIEHRLSLSLCEDFTSIYRFAGMKQRRFLRLFFIHYEISLLKQCLHKLVNHSPVDADLALYQSFFESHSRLDFSRLIQARTLGEWIQALDGSPYYPLFSSLEAALASFHADMPEHNILFDYEIKLDMYYFRSVWKARRHFLSKEDQAVITSCFGTNMDLLNLQWIYRSKQFYRLRPDEIYALLIPIHAHLAKDTITALAEAETMEEFWSVVRLSYYGNLPTVPIREQPDIEELSRRLMDRIYQVSRQRHPYSIASVYSYLYYKELELKKIIMTLECVRYGVPVSQIS